MGQPRARSGHADSAAPRARIVIVTPAKASAMLAGNVVNRHLSEQRIREYVAMMLDGVWSLTWDAIAIDAKGVLRNGQHRLHAIVRSGVSCRFLVVEGIEEVASDIGDRGSKRTLGHIFQIHKEPNANALAALVRGMWIFETTGVPFGGFGQRTTALYPHVAHEVLDRHPGLRDHLNRPKVPLLTPAAVGLLSYIFNYIDNDDAEGYFAVLAGQQTASADDARHLYRERLIREADAPAARRAIRAVGGMTLVAYAAQAWNAYRLGEKRMHFRWRPGGEHADRFPLIDGWQYTDEQLSALGYRAAAKAA